MRIEFSALAEQDLADGYAFYERQEEGLGEYFLDSLSADIDSLAIYAGIHPLAFGSHRLLAKTFPYAIYYDVIDSVVHVWAVADCRKNPQWIKTRVTRSRGL